MRRPQGYVTIVSPEGLVEYDTITCGHCQRVVETVPGTASTEYVVRHRSGQVEHVPGAFCRVCMHAVCLVCHVDGRCLPFERRLAQMEGHPEPRLY